MSNSLTEEIKFNFVVNKEKYLELKELIDLILQTDVTLNEGDTLKLGWTLYIDYLEQCHKKMLALIAIKNLGVLVEANIKELRRGRIIVEDFLKLMREIEVVTLSKAKDKRISKD